MKSELKMTVNGKNVVLAIEPTKLLVEVLREDLGLTGTKFSCSTGACCSCTVLLEGKAVKSCSVLALQANEKKIMTIEGLANEDKLNPIQQAFIENHGFACGFCAPGMMMAAKGLLNNNDNPNEMEIREAIGGHICRCGSYPKIVQSILEAARMIREGR